MNLQHAISGSGNDDRSRRLLADFERMGIPSTSPTEDVIRRIEDPKVPWNVRVALLWTATEAQLTSVADSLPTMLKTFLEREQSFEELQVLESAWWMCGDFARRYPLADLIGLADRSLEIAARQHAGNFDNLLSAVSEAVIACQPDGASDTPATEATRWLSAMKPEWLLALRAREEITVDGERFIRLATGKDVRPSRRLLWDWLKTNVEPSPAPYSSPAAGSESGEA